MHIDYPKVAKIGLLLIILVSIPVASLLNQRMQTIQSKASERRDSDRKESEDRQRKMFLVSGFVFEDTNKNQIKDSAEKGAENIVITLKFERRKESVQQHPFEAQATTDSLGFFKISVPKRSISESRSYKMSVGLPAGYVITTGNSRFGRREYNRRGVRLIVFGIARDASAQPTSTPAPTPTIVPSTIPSITPSVSPSIITPTEAITEIPTPVPSIVCPVTPTCDGELVTVDEGSFMCPLYMCVQVTPSQ